MTFAGYIWLIFSVQLIWTEWHCQISLIGFTTIIGRAVVFVALDASNYLFAYEALSLEVGK